MENIEVKIVLKAQNFAKASLMADGIQNVVNELGENSQLLIELADEATTKRYAAEVLKWINNPMLKRLIGV